MKLKLDENLGRMPASRLRNAGHDVETVGSERLQGSPDPDLIEIARREGRCLVTLDSDFANPLVYPPERFSGIAVLRLPSRPSHPDLMILVETLIRALAENEVAGLLWIVQPNRVREYPHG